MADAAESFPGWIEDPNWDMVQLGQRFLPGVCTVESLEVGCDIDVQKKRKKEKARLRDNGLSPVAFQIIVELTNAEWPAWVAVLPYIKPKEGGVRTPLKITHPLINLNGVNDVYVHKILYDAASARKGMKITIRIAEWFDQEKDAKTSKNVASGPPNKLVNGIGTAIANGLRRFTEGEAGMSPGALDNDIVRNTLFPAPPGNEENAAANTFED